MFSTSVDLAREQHHARVADVEASRRASQAAAVNRLQRRAARLSQKAERVSRRAERVAAQARVAVAGAI